MEKCGRASCIELTKTQRACWSWHKNEYAMTHLAKQFYDHTVVRRYTALVWGDVEADEATITGHLARHARFRKIMDVYPDGDHGKPAITHYKVLERLGYVTLVECRLETGRTHQIRIPFQHIGHPLFNDPEYEGNRIRKGTIYAKYKQFVENCFKIIPRQALHAQILGFVHPTTGEHKHFEIPLAGGYKNGVGQMAAVSRQPYPARRAL